MNTVTIERATADDVAGIAKMFLDDMAELKTNPVIDDLLRVTAAAVDAPGTFLWVARSGKQLAGVILANEFLSIKFPGKALWIEELYVDPKFRRGGVGRQLVEHFLEWAFRAGYRGIELEAYRMNTAASVLYRSLGFRRLARERYSCDMSELELDGVE